MQSAELFRIKFSDSGYVSETERLKQDPQQISRRTRKTFMYRLIWIETFQKWKAKTITVKPRWAKKAKARDEILTKFNSENPNGIKRDLSQL